MYVVMKRENANTDLPPLGNCNEFLLGYEGCAQLNFLYFVYSTISEQSGIMPVDTIGLAS